MKRFYVLAAIFIMLSFFSCAKKTMAEDTGMTQNDAVAAAPPNSSSALQNNTRLMVKNASMGLQADDVRVAVDSVKKIVETSGGYLMESNTYGNNNVHMRFGVPSSLLEKTLDSISKIGVETGRSISAEDVTDQVVDMEAELSNRKILRDKLRALLSKAKDVKDVLAVETELTRIQTEIDSIEGRLKKMKENISFSKVSISISPKKKEEILGPLGYVYVGVKWLVTKLFVIQSAE